MVKKTLLPGIGLWILSVSLFGQATILFETFESGVKPDGWTEIKRSGVQLIPWEYMQGGRWSDHPYPDTAAAGQKNAVFGWQSYNNEATMLVTKPVNLTGRTKPELRFWHAQATWSWGGQNYNDQLKVYYRIGKNGSWHQLAEYLVAVENWTFRQIPLPPATLTDSVFIGFEGITKYGNGTCIDNVTILETEISPLRISTVNISQATTQFVASGTQNNPVVKIVLNVIGNDGTCVLQNLNIRSKNTDDNDIALNGVKLYYTTDTFFNASVPLGTAQSLSGGVATFTGLNKNLQFGMNTVWVTFDLSETAQEGHFIDLQIDANAITVNGQTYPAAIADPAGARPIYQKIFIDDFETDKGWQLSGDFERDIPQGKGGVVVDPNFTGGSPDPTFAYSGTKVLGNDLNGIGTYPGNYELNVSFEAMNKAISPTLNLKYYKDVNISFYRWFNIYYQDDAQIQAGTDGINWIKFYGNEMDGGTISENLWNFRNYLLPLAVARKNNLKVRFTLGPTSDSRSYSGWNIDDFLVIGDFVAKDVGVARWISPSTGCGLSSAEPVTVVVKNFGAQTATTPIPVSYSLNGGQSWVTENINQNIAPDDSIIYTFNQKADLSVPQVYTAVHARTTYPEDEDNSNDQIDTVIYSLPYSSPPYVDDFEQDISFWRPYGKNSTWQQGMPNGYALKTTASGLKAWKTYLTSYYLDDDSSYLESPCFNFTGIEKPIVEFKLWHETEKDHDGLRLEYSTDNGSSWHIVPKDPYSYPWYWYNSSMVSALNSPGWDSASNGWVTARQFLPAACANQPLVKFRFHFESDQLTTYEGVGIDLFRLYEAPIDIGVSSFKDLSTACLNDNSNYLKVYVKNYGKGRVKSGEKIYLKAKVNNDPVVSDTITLSGNLSAGDSVLLTFTRPVNLNTPGHYAVKAWTNNEADLYFYQPIPNDTATKTIDIYPLPLIGLLDTMRSSRPDTITLRPHFDPNYDYYWYYNGSTASTLSIPGKGKYIVRVTDTRGNGCTNYDTTVVEKLTINLALDSILHPVNSCELGTQEHVTIRVFNAGNDTLSPGDTIHVGFTFEGGPVNTGKKVLTTRLYPGQFTTYTFSGNDLDMSQERTYSLKTFLSFKYDSLPTNDTLQRNVTVFGYPTVNIGPDTVIYGLTYQLDAGPGYKTYLWNNGDTTQTYIARFMGNHWVRVTDIHDCPAYDTAFIHLVIHDVSPAALVQPTNSCLPQGSKQIRIRVQNSGTDTISAGEKIAVAYRIDGGLWTNDTVTLSSPMYPSQYLDHSFTPYESFNTIGAWNIEASTLIPGDINPANDTATFIVHVWGNPPVNLGNDTTVKALSYLLDAGAGPNRSFLWRDGSTNQTYTVTQSGFYFVKVTDTISGCFSRDTVVVQLVIDDVGVTNWIGDTALCSAQFNGITVTIKNLGTPPYPANKKIPVYYILDGNPVVKDTLTLQSTLAPSGTVNFTIKKWPVVPSGPASISVFTSMQGDLRPENDTLKRQFAIYPSPAVNLGGTNDTIHETVGPVVLDAGNGFASYYWQDGSTEQTYPAISQGWYWVQVTNEYGCPDTDSVFLHLTTGIANPEDQPVHFAVYPNPASDHLFFKAEFRKTTNLELEILDVQGRTIMNRHLSGDRTYHEIINLNTVSPGVYIMKIFNSDFVQATRFIVR